MVNCEGNVQGSLVGVIARGRVGKHLERIVLQR